MADIEKPLSGVTVVELGHSVAAPYAGLILADLGARVIKVENPGGGDYARGWGPPFWRDTASVFHALNRGKEGITVDFRDAHDCAKLKSLILEKADGVIQNLRPGILAKFGLTAEQMRAEKPALICKVIPQTSKSLKTLNRRVALIAGPGGIRVPAEAHA